MDENAKRRYEYLKKKNQEKNKQERWENNTLFMECIQKIGDFKMISENECEQLLEKISLAIPFFYSGHIKWDETKCEKKIVEYDQLKNYIDVSKYYYVIWDDYEIPPIKCRLQSIIDNVDDVEAVSFGYLIISDDYKIVLESKKFGSVNFGIL